MCVFNTFLFQYFFFFLKNINFPIKIKRNFERSNFNEENIDEHIYIKILIKI